MKKLVTIILIVSLIIPAAASANMYEAALGMSMSDFLQKYNSIQAPLGSPYVQLSTSIAENWTNYNGYWWAWCYPENTRKIALLLGTKDPECKKNLSSGLDMIQIYCTSPEDLIPLMGIAMRCSTPFSTDLLGTSMASFYVAETIKYYYENNFKAKDMISYMPIVVDGDIVLALFYSNGYYFQISTQEAFQ